VEFVALLFVVVVVVVFGDYGLLTSMALPRSTQIDTAL